MFCQLKLTRLLTIVLALSLGVLASRPVVSCGPGFVRGDADASGKIEITDGIFILNYLFLGTVEPGCLSSADVDDSGMINLSDAIRVLTFLFLGGLPPAEPYPECGFDDTPDDLGCIEEHPDCAWSMDEFEMIGLAYGTLHTVAGTGASTELQGWLERFEDGPATEAELSAPHITLADDDGNLYIADKEAHAVRKVAPDGTITTFAGMNVPGDDGDEPGPARERHLREPNGLWVRADGVVYILDMDNDKVRKVDTDGVMTTLFAVPGLRTGRGLWVSDAEDLAYVTSRTLLVKWTPDGGVTTFASGFSHLGTFVVEPDGRLAVTDRNAHRVYRVDTEGNKTVIAGNGLTTGGGDGFDALETGLDQVRGIWPGPEFGGYFLATQAGSQVWYLDSTGILHLFLDGSPDGTHAGDGENFDTPGKKVSNLRSVTMDRQGNLLITEHDAGYVRRVDFLGVPVPPPCG